MAIEPSAERELSAWRAAFETDREPPAAGCPADERLAALVTGELAGPERDAVADHVVGCRRCAAAYRTLVELDAAARRLSTARDRRPWLWAAAASLVVASGLAIHLGRFDGAGAGRERGDVLRSVAEDADLSPVPGAVLAAAPAGFRWPAVAGARGTLRLFDVEGEPVWESGFEEAGTLALPSEVAGRLRPGAAYYWVVESPAGGARGRLGPYWFELAAR
jgi:hypothetical protein